MRGIWVFLVVLGVLYCAPASFAQKRQNVMQISPAGIKVQLALLPSPLIGYNKQQGEVVTDYRWLQVKITYNFDVNYRAGTTLDNMRCEVYLRTIASPDGWLKNYWLTGTQQLFSVIPGREGTKHQILMFVPPPLVYKATGGRKLNAKITRDCIVYVRFYDGEKLLGRKIWSGTVKKEDKRFEAMARNAYSRMNDNPANKIVNGLWPQEKTPWQWLSADRMDLPRTVFESAPSSKADAADEDAAESEKDSEKDNGKGKDTGRKNKGSAEAEETPGEVEFTRSADESRRRGNKRKK
ncbi:MAG: hypothetical protein J6A21_07930 [Lentisphaeria bacterium]|nr:hypothetical protein [Lentisphaeria bacterium]